MLEISFTYLCLPISGIPSNLSETIIQENFAPQPSDSSITSYNKKYSII